MRRKSTRILGLLLGLALTAVASAQSKLTSVTATSVAGGCYIDIKGEDLDRPRQFSLSNGRVWVAEFKNTVLTSRGKYVKLGQNGIAGVNIAQFTTNPPVARVVISASRETTSSLKEITGGWRFIVGDASVQAPNKLSVAPAPTPKSDEAKKANPKPIFALPSLTIEKTQTHSETVTTSSGQQAAKFPEAVPALILNAKPTAKKDETHKMPMVSLNFVQADVVQILRALALQSNMNIVISPEITGGSVAAEAPATTPGLEGGAPPPPKGGGNESGVRRITVTLNQVGVDEALDLITSLADLRYAKVGPTYVVTTKERFSDTMRNLAGRSNEMNEIRVVGIVSGQGGEIKNTLNRWFGPTILEVVVPEASVKDVSSKEGTGAKGNETTDTKETKGGTDPYLILIGAKKWVDQAEALTKELDARLAKMAGVDSVEPDSLIPMSATYQVRTGSAEELANAIRFILKDDGASRGNITLVSTPKESPYQTVYVHGRKGEVTRILGMLTDLDNIPPGMEPVFYVYDVKAADPRALREQLMASVRNLNVAVAPQGVAGRSYKKPGEQKTTGSGTTTTGGGTGSNSGGTVGQKLDASPVFGLYEGDAVPMKLVLSGTQSTIDVALEVLKRLDQPLPQFAIEARVVEMTKEDILKAGIDWDWMSGGFLSFVRFNNSQDSPSNSGQVHFVRGGSTLDITASLDKIINKNNLIARPNVVATDGRESVVFIGDVVRYIKNLQSTQNGITVEIGEEEVGVKLNVLPRVTADNRITMDVQPTVSFIKSYLATGTGGQVPTTSVRTVRTTMTLMDGETFAIGGLISDEDRKNISGVPILMDLPLIGNLFKKTTNTKVKTEIIIFITVHVLGEREANVNKNTGGKGN